jgi:hypothetical protein
MMGFLYASVTWSERTSSATVMRMLREPILAALCGPATTRRSGTANRDPRLGAVEDHAVDVSVLVLEDAAEVPPCRPVGRARLDVVSLQSAKYRPGRHAGDVVAAGDDHAVVRLEAEQRTQSGEERDHLVELAQPAWPPGRQDRRGSRSAK